MKDKRKHHFVPVGYLKHFADDNGFLNILRKGDRISSSKSKPSETGFRNYYYSQPLPEGGYEHNSLEDVFSKFETDWPNTVEVLSSDRPANSVLKHLMAFIGLQRVRVPAFRDAIEQSMEAHARRNFELLRNTGELPFPPPDFPDIADHVQISVDPHRSIYAVILTKNMIGSILDSFGYVVIHNETAIDFITSDNPVCYFLAETSENNIVPYSWHHAREREFIFPVSPRVLIYGSSRDRERFRGRGLKRVRVRDLQKIIRLNRLVARFSYEVVFSRTKINPAFLEKFANASPVLDPRFEGFHPDDAIIPPYIFGPRRRLTKWDKK